MTIRRLRWTLAITAVIIEVALFIAWRLWLRTRHPQPPSAGA